MTIPLTRSKLLTVISLERSQGRCGRLPLGHSQCRPDEDLHGPDCLAERYVQQQLLRISGWGLERRSRGRPGNGGGNWQQWVGYRRYQLYGESLSNTTDTSFFASESDKRTRSKMPTQHPYLCPATLPPQRGIERPPPSPSPPSFPSAPNSQHTNARAQPTSSRSSTSRSSRHTSRRPSRRPTRSARSPPSACPSHPSPPKRPTWRRA